jgi:hypothetical protein
VCVFIFTKWNLNVALVDDQGHLAEGDDDQGEEEEEKSENG